MRYLCAFCVTMVGIALLVGCEKKEKDKAPPKAQPPAVTGTETAQTPKTPTPPPIEVKTPATMPAMPNVDVPLPKVDPAAAEAATKEAVTKDATSKFKQLMGYIKDKKLDLAEELLKKLEGIKASLPADLQSKIDGARTALNAAKTLDTKLPAIPGVGK